jgi:hypothetical protein
MKFQGIICLLLCGCGGGGGGGAGAGVPADDFDGLYDQVTGGGVTPIAALPTQGSFAYSGLVRLNLPIDGPAQAFEGTFDVTLGFDAGGTPVTGTVADLFSDSIVLTGVLQIDSGAMNPNANPGMDYQFVAGLGGVLDNSGTLYLIDGTVAGDFYGAQWDGVAGVIFGDITQGVNIDIFDGAFVGEISP